MQLLGRVLAAVRTWLGFGREREQPRVPVMPPPDDDKTPVTPPPEPEQSGTPTQRRSIRAKRLDDR
jgi:hypothetical protein